MKRMMIISVIVFCCMVATNSYADTKDLQQKIEAKIKALETEQEKLVIKIKDMEKSKVDFTNIENNTKSQYIQNLVALNTLNELLGKNKENKQNS